MDLIQSYFSCQHPLGKVCVRRSFFSSPLSWDTWIWIEGVRAVAWDKQRFLPTTISPPRASSFPIPLCFGPILEISTKPCSSPLLPNHCGLRGKLLPGRWQVMPRACVRGAGPHPWQGAQQSTSAKSRMLPPSRSAQRLRAAWLRWALPSCGAAESGQSPSQSQELPPRWESSSSQHPWSWDAQTHPPTRQFAVHYVQKLWGSNNWLTDTNLPLHGSPAHGSSTARVTRAWKVRCFADFTDEKTGLVLQYEVLPLW